jgi:hypothetical protein
MTFGPYHIVEDILINLRVNHAHLLLFFYLQVFCDRLVLTAISHRFSQPRPSVAIYRHLLTECNFTSPYVEDSLLRVHYVHNSKSWMRELYGSDHELLRCTLGSSKDRLQSNSSVPWWSAFSPAYFDLTFVDGRVWGALGLLNLEGNMCFCWKEFFA